MIMGIFGGITVTGTEKKIDRLRALKAEVHADINRAIADRYAALNEIKAELAEFEGLKTEL
jgi:hypothetical protein